jgi:hypothetical protein
VQKKAQQLVLPKEKRNKILKDIDLLHLSTSRDVFEKASHLFVTKWEGEPKNVLNIFNMNG